MRKLVVELVDDVKNAKVTINHQYECGEASTGWTSQKFRENTPNAMAALLEILYDDEQVVELRHMVVEGGEVRMRIFKSENIAM